MQIKNVSKGIHIWWWTTSLTSSSFTLKCRTFKTSILSHSRNLIRRFYSRRIRKSECKRGNFEASPNGENRMGQSFGQTAKSKNMIQKLDNIKSNGFLTRRRNLLIDLISSSITKARRMETKGSNWRWIGENKCYTSLKWGIPSRDKRNFSLYYSNKKSWNEFWN